MAALRTSYPPLEPFAVHRLPVGDGHELHVQRVGNPRGIPVWRRFPAPVPTAERDDVLGAYHRRLTGDDSEEAARWAAPWLRWEFVNSSSAPDPAFLEEVSTSAQAVGAARILAHYAAHRGFLRDDDELLDGLARVRHLPAVLVQGALDLCCPPVTAWEVAQRWPRARLELVPGAGHSAREPGVLDRLVRATDSFADLLER